MHARSNPWLACASAASTLLVGCSSGGGGGSGGSSTLSGTILGPTGGLAAGFEEVAGLPGVIVEVISGTSSRQTTTDSAGNFILLQPPTGSVSLHVDGSNVAGGTFPTLELAIVIGGGANHLPQPIVLPDLQAGVTVDVAVDAGGAVTDDTAVGDLALDGFRLDIPMGTLITVDGVIPGAPVPVNVTPVDAINVPMPLPGALKPGAFVTLQPGGAAFDPPLGIALPNTGGFPVGALVDMWSFDHQAAAWVNRSDETGNRGTVMDLDEGQFIVASGVITEGGWHAGVLDVDPSCATTLTGQVFVQGSQAMPLPDALISLSTGQFARTGADGRFRVESVPAYDASLLPGVCMAAALELRALGPVSHGANLVDATVPALTVVTGGTTNLPAFDMPVSATGSLVGAVADSSGSSVVGSVEITGPQNLTVPTDDSGGFFASALEPGSYEAAFVFESQLSDVEPFTVTQNQLTVVNLREPGGAPGESAVVVRVVDLTVPGSTGAVPQACVTLQGVTGAPLFRVADAVGIAEFENVPDGPYTVTAQIERATAEGTERLAASVVGVNANGTPPTIVVPFLSDAGIGTPIPLDAMLEGTITNPPVGLDLRYQIAADAGTGFFAEGSADPGFLEDVPSDVPLDVGVVAIDPASSAIVSGIFLADVQATQAQTLSLDFDFGSASVHAFDRVVPATYTNVQAHDSFFAQLFLGDLLYSFSPFTSLPDSFGWPDFASAKFLDLAPVLEIGSDSTSPIALESSCSLPLTTTPAALVIAFLTPPAIQQPAQNSFFPTYGPGNRVEYTLGAGTGTGAGVDSISFFHEGKASALFASWNLLVAPGTVQVTLPPVFPGKPMFAAGFARVNVDTLRFTFPGFQFADFFDQNLPAHVAAVQASRLCGADREHFFTIGSAAIGSGRGALEPRLSAARTRSGR